MAKIVLDATPHVRLLFLLPVLLVSCLDGQGILRELAAERIKD